MNIRVSTLCIYRNEEKADQSFKKREMRKYQYLSAKIHIERYK